ncbi:MAG: nucleotidyl transferase AbiEii/AbiGii toxin family protein [Bacteroidales bacterium]|nr:nucleotidyl transferase AbiEii/AbiGii toxin family protein [Bacteroidales bacterium]
MIPQTYITEWSGFVPWKTNEQVEHDLVISRAIIEIFSDQFLFERLAFRGGTALHKIYLKPQSRYSEDIDLVQIVREPFGPVIDHLRERLNFLSSPGRKINRNIITLKFHFESEIPPVQPLKLKVETNCSEHFTVLGYQKSKFKIESSWFSGSCILNTYKPEELIGTKIRALYQRRKGRDLYNLYKTLITIPELNREEVLACYRKYISHSVSWIVW